MSEWNKEQASVMGAKMRQSEPPAEAERQHVNPAKTPSVLRQLGFALNGLRYAWQNERGFRRQLYGALAMAATLVILMPSPVWWAMAALASSLLLALELINTAIERSMDVVDRRIREDIKVIKDMAAAAVIVVSIGTLFLGLAMIAVHFGLFAG